MGRIQQKRGSVRQVPPTVYSPFVQHERDDDQTAGAISDMICIIIWVLVLIIVVPLFAWIFGVDE